MATHDLQELIRVIRRRYGPQDNPIKLSELLFFLDSYQNPAAQAGNTKTAQAAQKKLGHRNTPETEACGTPKTHKRHKTNTPVARETTTVEYSTNAAV